MFKTTTHRLLVRALPLAVLVLPACVEIGDPAAPDQPTVEALASVEICRGTFGAAWGCEAVEAGEAVHARARYNTAMKSLEAVIAASPAPDLLLEAREAIHRILMDGRDAQVMRSAIDAYAADLVQARLRTAEMVAHAQDRSQVEALGRLLQAAGGGPEFTCVELGQAEGVLAWALFTLMPNRPKAPAALEDSGSSVEAEPD